MVAWAMLTIGPYPLFIGGFVLYTLAIAVITSVIFVVAKLLLRYGPVAVRNIRRP